LRRLANRVDILDFPPGRGWTGEAHKSYQRKTGQSAQAMPPPARRICGGSRIVPVGLVGPE
jgi:uncharacterized protein YukE